MKFSDDAVLQAAAILVAAQSGAGKSSPETTARKLLDAISAVRGAESGLNAVSNEKRLATWTQIGKEALGG